MDRIKESFDSLPIAACFFDENGVVRLVNRRMLAIANWLRKGGIQSLEEMQSALHSPPANVRCLDRHLRIYRFPDGKALRFAQEQIASALSVRIHCLCGSFPVSRTLTPNSSARFFAASSGSDCAVIWLER